MSSGEPPIPYDVSAALRTYLMGAGLKETSADGLLEALSQDLADGDADARVVLDRLVTAATVSASERIEASVREIIELASIPMAPEMPENAEVD